MYYERGILDFSNNFGILLCKVDAMVQVAEVGSKSDLLWLLIPKMTQTTRSHMHTHTHTYQAANSWFANAGMTMLLFQPLSWQLSYLVDSQRSPKRPIVPRWSLSQRNVHRNIEQQGIW